MAGFPSGLDGLVPDNDCGDEGEGDDPDATEVVGFCLEF